MIKIDYVNAHCDIPCKVYDPYMAQYAAISVLRLIDLIDEMPDNPSSNSIISSKRYKHAAKL